MMISHALVPPGRRALATMATMAVTGMGLAAMSPAAQAATPHAATTAAGRTALRESFTIPAGQADYTATVDGAHIMILRNSKVSPETTCTISVEYPYPSGGYVQGYAQVTCTGEVYEIVLEVALFYDASSGWIEENSVYTYQFNTFDATAFIKAPVLTGDWQTAAAADVYGTSSTSSVQLGPVDSAVEYI